MRRKKRPRSAHGGSWRQLRRQYRHGAARTEPSAGAAASNVGQAWRRRHRRAQRAIAERPAMLEIRGDAVLLPVAVAHRIGTLAAADLGGGLRLGLGAFSACARRRSSASSSARSAAGVAARFFGFACMSTIPFRAGCCQAYPPYSMSDELRAGGESRRPMNYVKTAMLLAVLTAIFVALGAPSAARRAWSSPSSSRWP